MPSELANKAIELLSPTIGDFLARAKVRAACNMSGADIDTLTRAQLGPFADQFELVCKTSLGADTAKRLKEALQRG